MYIDLRYISAGNIKPFFFCAKPHSLLSLSTHISIFGLVKLSILGSTSELLSSLHSVGLLSDAFASLFSELECLLELRMKRRFYTHNFLLQCNAARISELDKRWFIQIIVCVTFIWDSFAVSERERAAQFQIFKFPRTENRRGSNLWSSFRLLSWKFYHHSFREHDTTIRWRWTSQSHIRNEKVFRRGLSSSTISNFPARSKTLIA